MFFLLVKSKDSKLLNHTEDVEGGDSETTDSTVSHSDESAADDADTESHRDDKVSSRIVFFFIYLFFVP